MESQQIMELLLAMNEKMTSKEDRKSDSVLFQFSLVGLQVSH
jgi:hypothetical protein